MSTLELKELSHPAGEVIKIASGKTLDLKSQGSTTLPTGSVLQVVNLHFTTQTATSGTSYVDSGITLSITPSSTSSKVFVTVTVGGFEIGPSRLSMYTNLVRGSTQIFQPNGYVGYPGGSTRTFPATSYSFLDSPATTSSTTYKVQFKGAGGSGAVTLNVNASESTITLTEIQG
jgi:hypothetical protein